jgi:hypothetical protein
MVKRRSVDIQVDDRTATMSVTSLKCRSKGHWMEDVPLPMTPKQRTELAAHGLEERTFVCRRPGCTYTVSDTVNLLESYVVKVKSSYGENKNLYLMAPEHRGTGRISRLEAWKALRSRRD